MIICEIVVGFGNGNISIVLNKFTDVDLWYIKILQNKIVGIVGDDFKKENAYDEPKIILTFPTEMQMLNVAAAMANRSYEEIKIRFDMKGSEYVD